MNELRDALGKHFRVGDRVTTSTGRGLRVGTVLGIKQRQYGGPTFTLELEKTSSYWNQNKRHTFEYDQDKCLLLSQGSVV